MRSRFVLPAMLAAAILIPALAASAAPATVHVRGTISRVTPTELVVATASGDERLAITPKTGVAAVVPGSRSDIKPGTFIGTANIAHGDMGRAQEVVVFPNSMRGTGEGNYPWDMQSSGGSSMMTNGTVAPGGTSMMTNGTVAAQHGHGQLTLTVTYKGGSQRVVVPANVPIVRIEKGSRALLAEGAHVFVIAAGSPGHLHAMRVIVGKDGATPPM
jgi:hypothetical protein